MDIALTTPALLLPASTLLLLGLTNRFLALAGVLRTLRDRYREHPEEGLRAQILNLRLRCRMMRASQAAGMVSLALTVLAMFVVYVGGSGPGWCALLGSWVFAASLVLMFAALSLALVEILVSVDALEIEVSDL